jgi:hypothetical protein
MSENTKPEPKCYQCGTPLIKEFSVHFADSPDQGAQYHGEDNCLLE